MIKVIELKVDVEPKKEGVTTRFEGGLNSSIAEMFTEEEDKKVENAICTICRTINTAIMRDIQKTVSSISEMFEEEDEDIDDMIEEFEEGLKNCKTLEEKLAYTLKEIEKTITRN